MESFSYLYSSKSLYRISPIRALHYSRVDKIVHDLRRIYKENPAPFDVPAFAQKVY